MPRRIVFSLSMSLFLLACQGEEFESIQAEEAACGRPPAPPLPPVSTTTTVPVSQDAAVIYASLGLGVVPDRNYGADASVNIGEYHLTSEGLFGFSLAGLVPANAIITRAELLVAAPYAPGGQQVTLRLNRITSAWSESTVTWNSKPAYQFVREIALKSGVENRVDVTDLIVGGELNVALQPSTQPSTDNVFIDAKESGRTPTSLIVTWHP